MKKKKVGIRYSIMLAAAILPMVLLLIVIYIWTTAHSLISVSKDDFSARTGLCATKMDDWTGEIIGEMNIYRDVLEGYNGDQEKMIAFLTTTYETHDAYPQGLYVGSESGMYLDGAGWVPGDDWVLQERPWFIAGKNSADFIFCEPYVDAQLGVICTSVSARMRHNDEACVVAADVYIDYADALIREVTNAGSLDGALFVSGDNHMILTDSTDLKGGVSLLDSGYPLYAQLDTMLTEGKSGIDKVRTPQGSYYVSIIRLTSADWYLIGYVRDSTLLAPLWKSSLVMGLVGLAAVLILVFLTRFVSITYRSRLSQAETRAQENLDMINAIIGSGMWYMEFNEQGEMASVHWSHEFRSMLGFHDPADFPDRLESWSDRLHPQDKEATLRAYWDCVAGKDEYDVSYRLMKHSGEYEWFKMHGRTVCHPNGRPRLFLGTFINVTKELQAQQALEEACQAANRANEAKTEFLSSMSHDIRTPLNGIIGMTAIAEANLDDEAKLKHCLSEISISSQHLLELINEVLDMSKIESGKLSLNLEPFDLLSLVQELVTISAPLVNAKQHTFTVDTHDVQHSAVIGDRPRLQQSLMNFVSNAVKYTPPGGTIRLTVHETTTGLSGTSCYEFIFEDNGIGMSEEFIPTLFDAFTRASDERTQKQQGTGLGMAITRNVLRMMNGDIRVESKLNEGSRFTATAYLELQAPGEKAPENELRQVSLQQFREAGLDGKRVLMAEDNELNAEIAVELLGMANILVDHVWNGQEAVEKLRSMPAGHYDLVFMDIRMPVMDGYEATRQIRSSEREDLHTVPIIALSANAFTEDVEMAKAAGMDGHIAKPLDLNSLMGLLQHWLGPAAEGSAPPKD